MNKEVEKEPYKGPVKWCKHCSRKHPSRQKCALVAVIRTAESGRRVSRFVNADQLTVD